MSLSSSQCALLLPQNALLFQEFLFYCPEMFLLEVFIDQLMMPCIWLVFSFKVIKLFKVTSIFDNIKTSTWSMILRVLFKF